MRLRCAKRNDDDHPGEVLDDREAMDHLAAIVLREWRKTMPEPLPVTRRARRSQ